MSSKYRGKYGTPPLEMDGNDPRSRDKGYDRGRYPKGGSTAQKIKFPYFLTVNRHIRIFQSLKSQQMVTIPYIILYTFH